MADTYDSIATVTLSSAQSTIEFSAIPATFTDLRVVLNMAINGTNGRTPQLRFNGDNAFNYAVARIEATGTARNTSLGNSQQSFNPWNWAPPANARARHLHVFDVLSYRSGFFPTILYAGGGGDSISRSIGRWASTSAVSSITLLCSQGDSQFATGTVATLFGIQRF